MFNAKGFKPLSPAKAGYKGNGLFFILALLYVITRIVIIFGSEKIISQGEEPYVGAIAQGMIEGWAWPIWDFQVQPYHGGSLVNALITLPLFILFGPYMIALKSAAILFYLVTMFVFFFLLRKYFNLRVALIACLLYIVSPPLFTARTLIFNGSLTETVFFNTAIILIFFNLIFNGSRTKDHFLLGIASGIGLWYSYANIPVIITYTLCWFIKDRIFFLRRQYAVYLLSFLIGLTPWFIFNQAFNFTGLAIARYNIDNFANFSFSSFTDKAYALISEYGYKIFMFESLLPFKVGDAFNVIYFLFLALSFLYVVSRILKRTAFSRILRKGKNSRMGSGSSDEASIKEFAIALYPVVFILILGSSVHYYDNTGYGIIDYRYALLLFPSIFILIALFIDGLYSARNNFVSASGKVVLAILLIMGAFGNGYFINSGNFTNRWLFTSACNYELAGKVAGRRYGLGLDNVKAMFKKINKNFLGDAYRGYGMEQAKRGAGINDLGAYAKLAVSIDAGRFRNEYLYGVGFGIADSIEQNKQRFRESFMAAENSEIDRQDKSWIILGMLERGLAHEHIFISLADALEIMPPGYHASIHFLYAVNKARRGPKINNSPACGSADKFYERYCYMGLGAGVASFYSGDKKKILVFFDKFSKDKYSFLIDGVGIYLYRINSFNKKALADNFPAEWADQRANFFKQAGFFDELIGPYSGQ